MPYVDFSHGDNIYEIRREYGKDVIDFSANINPLGLPAAVKRAIKKNLDKILHYPDSNATGLVQKIARYWGISENNLLLGNGSVELIYLIIASFKPRITFIPVPTFSEYERASRNINSEIRFLRLQEREGFKWDFPSPDNADIIFLCHPNNPTGNFILDDPGEIGQLGNRLIIVDEAFMDFIPEQKDYTLIWKAAKSRNIVVLRTFTKLFAMPGLRLGYLVAHPGIINRLRQHQPPWSINSLAQVAAQAILNETYMPGKVSTKEYENFKGFSDETFMPAKLDKKGDENLAGFSNEASLNLQGTNYNESPTGFLNKNEYVGRTQRLIEKERGFLFSRIAKIEGLRPYPSRANFLLIRIEKSGLTSSLLRKGLIRKGILIRDCSNFRNLDNRYIRIAVRSHKENLKLIEALKGEI